MTGKENKPYRGLMYGALDDAGNRVGNSIKSSLIGQWVGLPSIENKCTYSAEYLRDLDRRKALVGRIRQTVAECIRRGDASQRDIERRLSEIGISAVFRHNEDGRLTGATFIDHRGKSVYNGSNLGKDLSANTWYALLSKQREPERQTSEIALSQSAESKRSVVQPQPTPESTSPKIETRRPAEQEGETPRPAEPECPTSEVALSQSAESKRSVVQPQPTDEASIVINPATPPSEPETKFGDEFEEEIKRAPQGENYAVTDRETNHRTGHNTLGGLSRPGGTYEEIDPEFRTLYKKKKSIKKRR